MAEDRGTPQKSEERYRVVYRVAVESVRPMLKSDADAEDVAHETWIAVERALERAKDSGGTRIRNFEAWVRRIAVNRAINLYKSRWKRVLRSQPDPDARPELESALRSPEEHARLREYEAELAAAVSKIGKPFRKAFALHYRGHSYEEIAEILDRPIGTIKGRVHRARKKIAELVEGFEADPPDDKEPDSPLATGTDARST